jgi:hypothetical protein
MGIYFIVAYIKRYLKNISDNKFFAIAVLVIGVIGWLLEKNTLILVLGMKIELFSHLGMKTNQFINPCFIMIGIGLLLLAKNQKFYNRTINYISSLSLLIYMFHCNSIVANYVEFDFFEYILKTYSYNNILVWVLIFSLISLVGGTILALVYNLTIQKVVHKIFSWIADVISKIYSGFEKYIIQLD